MQSNVTVVYDISRLSFDTSGIRDTFRLRAESTSRNRTTNGVFDKLCELVTASIQSTPLIGPLGQVAVANASGSSVAAL